MKMAERQNILAMGLDPSEVISFGGGWVNHEAPDEFRQAYESIVSDADLFHKSGAYTATLPLARPELPAITEKDMADMVLAAELGADYVALSFVRSAADMEQLRAPMRERGTTTNG